jgi:hypothetical protein
MNTAVHLTGWMGLTVQWPPMSVKVRNGIPALQNCAVNLYLCPGSEIHILFVICYSVAVPYAPLLYNTYIKFAVSSRMFS